MALARVGEGGVESVISGGGGRSRYRWCHRRHPHSCARVLSPSCHPWSRVCGCGFEWMELGSGWRREGGCSEERSMGGGRATAPAAAPALCGGDDEGQMQQLAATSLGGLAAVEAAVGARLAAAAAAAKTAKTAASAAKTRAAAHLAASIPKSPPPSSVLMARFLSGVLELPRGAFFSSAVFDPRPRGKVSAIAPPGSAGDQRRQR